MNGLSFIRKLKTLFYGPEKDIQKLEGDVKEIESRLKRIRDAVAELDIDAIPNFHCHIHLASLQRPSPEVIQASFDSYFFAYALEYAQLAKEKRQLQRILRRLKAKLYCFERNLRTTIRQIHHFIYNLSLSEDDLNAFFSKASKE